MNLNADWIVPVKGNAKCGDLSTLPNGITRVSILLNLRDAYPDADQKIPIYPVFNEPRNSGVDFPIKLKTNHEGCPGRTSLRMHRPQFRASYSSTGPYGRSPFSCPGIGFTRWIFTGAQDRYLFFDHRPYAVSIGSLAQSGTDIPAFPVQPGKCDLLYRFRVIGCVNPDTDRYPRCTPDLSFLRHTPWCTDLLID
jgi:hypothetical protein